MSMAVLALAATLQASGSPAPSTPAASTPRERLIAAAQASSFLDTTLKSWHLKLDVTLYDAAGKNPVTGTIETWHSGKQSLTVSTFGAAKRTRLATGDNFYQSLEGPSVPAQSDYILSEFLDPGPSLKDIDGSKIELHTENFGTIQLDCMMLTQTMKHESPFPLGLFPTYCLDKGDNNLRASYNFGSHSLLRNGLGHFQGREAATHLSWMDDQIKIADVKVSAFTTFTPSDDTFQPDPAWTIMPGGSVRVAGGVIAGAIVDKPTPVYPQYAKANHISGAVVLHAIIGRDGRIYSLRPVSAPETSLAVAAIQAVRHWTYKPYLLNGMPTDVDTTITVNFNISSF